VSVLLQTVGLCCDRDERPLVVDLNLQVKAGNIYQIEGPNGSGKTTLLRVLCGLSSRYTGELHWRGQALPGNRGQYLSELLYIGHSSGVKALLTVRENLRWHARAMGGAGADSEEQIIVAIERVGLYGYEDVPCFSLSAGQQRRVGLARLFIGQMALWILDEPFTAIDRQGVLELEGWVEQFEAGGGAVVLTTHHPLAITRAVHCVALGSN
jgi:heme exporter protein A